VLGGAFGLLAMYVRRLLAETPVFLELKARQALASETPLKAVVRDYPGAVVLSGLLTWMLCRSSLSGGRGNRCLSRCTAFALQGWRRTDLKIEFKKVLTKKGKT
jgi:hypothetical protein